MDKQLGEKILKTLQSLDTQLKNGSSLASSISRSNYTPSSRSAKKEIDDDGIIDSLKKLNRMLQQNEKRMGDVKDKLIKSRTFSKEHTRLVNIQTKLADRVTDLKNQVQIIRNDSALRLQDINVNSADFMDASGKLARTVNNLDKSLMGSWNAIDKLNFNMNKSVISQASLLNGLLEGMGLENEAHDKFSEKMLKSSAALESFKKHTNDSTKSFHSIMELSEAVNSMAKEAGLFEKMMKDTNVPIDDYIQSLIDMSITGKELSGEQLELIKITKQAGLINADGSVKSADAFSKHITVIKSDIIAIQKKAQAELLSIKMMDGLKDKFGNVSKFLGLAKNPIAAISVLLPMLASRLADAWTQLWMLGDKGVFGYLKEVKVAQLQLGISAEAAAKMLSQNLDIVAANGGKANKVFTILSDQQKNMMKFGLSTEDAAQAVSDFIADAGNLGINVKDTNKLNKAVTAQTNAFGKLKAISGITIGEFKQMNDEMMNSEAVQMRLNALSESERGERLQQMYDMRLSFKQLGISVQSAQKAMLAAQELSTTSVKSKYADIGKLAYMARVSGMNTEQINKLIQARRTNNVADLQSMTQVMIKNLNQKKLLASDTNNDQLGIITDSALEKMSELSAPIQEMIKIGQEAGIKQAKQTTEGVTQAMNANQQMPDWMVTAEKFKGVLSSAITDPIVSAIGIAAAAVVAGALGSSGKLGGLASKAAGGIKNAAGALGSSGKLGGLASKAAGGIKNAAGALGPRAMGMMGAAAPFAAAGATAYVAHSAAKSFADSFGEGGFDLIQKLRKDDAISYGLGTTPEVDDWKKIEALSTNDLQTLLATKELEGGDLQKLQGIIDKRLNPQVLNNISSSVNPNSNLQKGVNSQGVNSSNASSSETQSNAMIVRLSDDTIAKLVSKLDELQQQNSKLLDVEEQARDFIELLVESNDKALQYSEEIANGSRQPAFMDHRLFSKFKSIQHI